MRQDAPVLVEAVSQEPDIFTIDQPRGSLLGPLAVGLALLGAVDAAEADAFRAVVVQNFDSVAIEDGDDGAGEVHHEYD